MTHLTPEEIFEAADGTLAAARQAHLASCETCHREAAELAGLLAEAARVEVPEPSPLFWDRFSARVREAVEQENRPSGGWRAWRWPALAPMGALAVALVAVVATLLGPVPGPQTPPATTAAAGVAASDEWLGVGGWDVVAELVGPLDWDTAGAAGLAVGPGDVDLVLLELDEGEQQELWRLLRNELGRPES